MRTSPGKRTSAGWLLGLLAVAPLLAGCATSTPITTMWRLYGFGPDDVVDVRPQSVRVAVKLPRPAHPAPEDAMLELAFEPDADTGRPTNHRLPMVLVNEGRTVRAAALPSAEPGYRWFLFKLTPSAENALERVQKALSPAGGGSSGSVAISVSNGYANAVPGQELTRSVWIQLSEEDGFFPLVEDETIRIGSENRVLS